MSTGMALVTSVTLLKAWTCARQLHCLQASADQPGYAAAVVRVRLALALLQGGTGIAVLAWLRGQAPHAALWLMAAVPGIACLPALVDIAGGALKCFVVDRRFGCNRTPPLLFAADALQQLALRGVVAVLLTLLALASMLSAGSWWALCFAASVMLLAWLFSSLYRRWIEPWRLRYAAMPSNGLGRRLEGCLRRCGFERAELVVEPGSRRSTHVNARAELSGRRGRVVLLDTLLQRLAPEQVEAVLAHELGHLAGRHLQRRFGWLCLAWAGVFAMAVALAANEPGPGGWNQWAAVPVLLWPLRFLLQPWMNRRLRRWELEADAFAAQYVSPVVLGATLEALFRANAAPARSDPWFAAFHESHPPLAQRLARLAGT